jgi:uncharacterized protein with HEPN domain
MQREDEVRIGHILAESQRVARFITGKTRDDLYGDELLALGLTRVIEIIGEAASKVSQETRASIPEIPWQAIIGMRNRLVHAYFDVDLNILWRAATEEVPKLAATLKAKGF